MGTLEHGGGKASHGTEENREEEDEPILTKQTQRFCMFPIRYKQLCQMYKKAEASFWTAEEGDLSHDVQHWQTLSDSEKHFIMHVLAFFASSDGIVLENLENIHSEMYSLLLEPYIKDSGEKHRLFNAIENLPCVAKKASGH